MNTFLWDLKWSPNAFGLWMEYHDQSIQKLFFFFFFFICRVVKLWFKENVQ